jgi:hypothetical protein
MIIPLVAMNSKHFIIVILQNCTFYKLAVIHMLWNVGYWQNQYIHLILTAIFPAQIT